MNLRLTLWTVGMAYLAFLFAHSQAGSSLSVMLAAAILGAVVGVSLGSMFANRAKRKHS
jgi:Na+/glutamate symporter